MLLYVHRNRRLIRDGTATSTYTQLLSSDIRFSLFGPFLYEAVTASNSVQRVAR